MAEELALNILRYFVPLSGCTLQEATTLTCPGGYQLPLLTQEEARTISASALKTISSIPTTSIFLLPDNNNNDTSSSSKVLWNAAQRWRIKHGLSYKPFIFDPDPAASSSSSSSSTSNILGSANDEQQQQQGLECVDARLVDAELRGDSTTAKSLVEELVRRWPDSERSWARFAAGAGAGAGAGQGAVACAAWAAAWRRSDDARRRSYYEKMVSASEAQVGGLFTDDDDDDDDDKRATADAYPVLREKWQWQRQWQSGMDVRGGGGRWVAPRQRLWVPMSAAAAAGSWHKLPRFFSWVVPGQLAGMSTPKCANDIRALAAHLGISLVVTLTEEEPLPQSWFGDGDVQNLFVPTRNLHPPVQRQMDLIMRSISEAEGGVLVHCGGGKGRAGTVLACWLALFGFDPVPAGELEPAKMDGKRAVSTLRAIRPGSVETERQEKFVDSYVSLAWRRYANGEPLWGDGGVVDEPPAPAPTPVSPANKTLLDIQGDISNADMLLLVGLQGSGKSTFSRLARMWHPTAAITVVSPDDAHANGSPATRAACETAVGQWRKSTSSTNPSSSDSDHHHHRHRRHRRILILDRCSPTAIDRAHWISLATSNPKTVAVHFDFSAQLCQARVELRTGHATLPPYRAASAIASTAAQFVAPSIVSEPGLAGVVRVTSIAQFPELLSVLFATEATAELPLMKYPRTPHLLSLGGATRDDLVLPSSFLSSPFLTSQHVTITEKLDGANLGFSLGPGGEIRVQNRSHYLSISSNSNSNSNNNNTNDGSSSTSSSSNTNIEQAQFTTLQPWLTKHTPPLHRILRSTDTLTQRWILYGEWLYAVHSIPYRNLPDTFLAFDMWDRLTQCFLDRAQLERRLRGSGIGMVPVVYEGIMGDGAEALVRGLLNRRSLYGDEKVEGVVVRWGGGGTMEGGAGGRGKVVRGDFIAGNRHWSKNWCTKNGVVGSEVQEEEGEEV